MCVRCVYDVCMMCVRCVYDVWAVCVCVRVQVSVRAGACVCVCVCCVFQWDVGKANGHIIVWAKTLQIMWFLGSWPHLVSQFREST